ncbi:TonB-dependent receptor [Catenovulum maritimum]|nr:TonB-dependent receptor [Catenovulum maritimum]
MKSSKILPLTLGSALSFTCLNTMAAEIPLTGVIVDSQSRPIHQAVIQVKGSKQKVKTDSNGQFKISLDTSKVDEIHITADGFAHVNFHLDEQPDLTAPLTIKLASSVMEVIDVKASIFHLSQIESAAPVSVLSNEKLLNRQAATLGETLKNELGIHSNFYGGVTASPIIRGLDGPRVMTAQNGLDTGDVSRVGPDHSITAEAGTAEQIEILRGPASLLFGSGAIGGVVNVVDNRVPSFKNNKTELFYSHSSVNQQDSASLTLERDIADFAFHLDGFWRQSDDYKIPEGEHHAEEEHEEDGHEEGHEEEHEAHADRVENSYSEASGITLGASYILDNGYIGLSYGRLDQEYGIPGHEHASHEEEEHDEAHEDEHMEEAHVFAKVKQNRYQLISELNLADNFINQINTRIGYTDYQHDEIEGDEIGTRFNSRSTEAKVEMRHNTLAQWRGGFTLHYKDKDYKAAGEEAFSPNSNEQTLALAWLEERHFDDLLIQLGARVEQVKISAGNFSYNEIHFIEEGEEDDHLDAHDDEHLDEEAHTEELFSNWQQSFNLTNVSLGFIWDFAQGYNLGVNLTRAQRAPSAAELLSFGPHLASNSYDIGAAYQVDFESGHVDDVKLKADIETSNNLDFSIRKFEGDTGFIFNLFYNRINNFYYQANVNHEAEISHEPHEEEGHDAADEAEEHEFLHLPVYQYQTDDATLKGIELQYIWQINSELKYTFLTDYIQVKLDNNGYAPRIPPLRIGSNLNYQTDSYSVEASWSYYAKQDKLAEYETATDGYHMLDLSFNYYLSQNTTDLTVFAKVQNLTNEYAQVHSSLIKQDSPLAARNFTLGIRAEF